MEKVSAMPISHTGTLILLSIPRGFGIIRQDGYPLDGPALPETDIFMHRTVYLKYPGIILPGARVTVDCITMSGKLRAVNLLNVVNVRPLRTIHNPSPDLPWQPATMKAFNYDTGYGFAIPDVAPYDDIFVHAEILRPLGGYVPYLRLEVQIRDTSRGANAIAARRIANA